jgi:phosphoribosyl 1,2-cyclic phosphate phosphodiesterase
MTLTFTILGCGSSGGVPRTGLGWGACDPNNPKNRRMRCSLLVERWQAGDCTRVLVDASPDLREQLLTHDVVDLDAVLFTHEHADHCHGIDDLRGIFLRHGRRIDAYLDEPTAQVIHSRFAYCFFQALGSDYPAILVDHRIEAGRPLTISGAGGAVEVLPLLHDHGDITALGFRFGNVAYSPDLRDMPPESANALDGLDLWIVDALRDRPHPTHFSVSDALAWINRLKPKRAILTNLHADLDYDDLRRRLPPNVEPAYDGMKITLNCA